MQNTRIATRPQARASRRRGFTLLEISVALAAVLVVALGLAAIFDSIGKTVAAGRRVSRLNQYARLLENQLRADFNAMSRDGFLVIRQQYADVDGSRDFLPAADRVQAFADDERARPRRVDEIMFFARGDFESQRAALPGTENWKAASNEASIYYGHGMIRPESGTPGETPKVNEANNFAVTVPNVPVLGRAIPNNPNRYAKDWILLRKATLLKQPESTNTAFASGITPPIYDATVANAATLLADKECQIAGRPAAASLFRSVNRMLVPGGWSADPPVYDDSDQWWRTTAVSSLQANYDDSLSPPYPIAPAIASGLVDIATTSISEVRSYAQGFAGVRYSGYNYGPFGRTRDPSPTLVPAEYITLPPNLLFPIRPPLPSADVAWTQVFPQLGPWGGRPTPPNFESIDYLHAWMDDAMPTRSIDAFTMDDIDQSNIGGSLAPLDGPNGVATRGTRVRCAVQAPGLLDILGVAPANAGEARALAMLRADAQMLAASNLVVGCSEFVVDWSFGEVTVDVATSPLPLLTNGTPASNPLFKPEGTTLFYGPPSYPSGTNPRPNWSAVAGFYQDVQSGPNATGSIVRPVPVRGGQTVNAAVSTAVPEQSVEIIDGIAQVPVSERMLYGYSPMDDIGTNITGANVPVPLSVSTFFGITDPTYNPDFNLDGDTDDDEDARTPQRVLPWQWPRLIRVRVTIADPVDPTSEGTFEFLFQTPGVPAGVQ